MQLELFSLPPSPETSPHHPEVASHCPAALCFSSAHRARPLRKSERVTLEVRFAAVERNGN
jgi:hypothetical protein